MTQATRTEARPDVGRNGGYAEPSAVGRPTVTYAPGRRHVLDLDDFSVGEIEDVFQNADAMREVMNREIKKVSDAEGEDGHHAVHGGEYADAGFFRAGGQDSERGRDKRVRQRQQCREGRVSVQYRADAAGDERGHHHHTAQSFGGRRTYWRGTWTPA